MHAGRDDGFVQLGQFLQRLGVVTRNHLDDRGQAVLLVARVDPLRRVADVEVLFPLHAGVLFQHGDAHLFGGTRVDGRLIDHRRATLHVGTDDLAGRDQRREIGQACRIDRRRHGHDDHIGLTQLLRIVRDLQLLGQIEITALDLAGHVVVLLQTGNLRFRHVETDRIEVFSKLDGQGQANVSQTNYCNRCHIFFQTVKSTSAFLTKNHLNGLDKHHEIEKQRVILDVKKIVFQLFHGLFY